MVVRAKSDPVDDTLDPETVEWLYELASANFKAQTDLDEAVWRSMSFVAALFAVSVAVFRGVQPHLNFAKIWPDWFAGTSYIFGIICFVVAFVYLVLIVVLKEFQQPAKDTEVGEYARKLTLWHRSRQGGKARMGKAVVVDLQLFMVNLLSEANERNLPIIGSRLVGRSRSILFTLAGFAFICLSEAIMFVSTL